MPTIKVKDGTQIYYKDWGTGQPIVFSHGWPLTADDWDGQMLFFGQQGIESSRMTGEGTAVPARLGWQRDGHLRRRSRRTHGEARPEERYSRRTFHRRRRSCALYRAAWLKRVAMAVLISAVPPLMVKTEKNPGGVPIEVFDDLRAQYAKNRPQFYKDLTLPFYGYNRPGAKISEGIREKWWLQGMMGGMKAALRLHQGLLRDGLHRRSQEVRRAHSHSSRRR